MLWLQKWINLQVIDISHQVIDINLQVIDINHLVKEEVKLKIILEMDSNLSNRMSAEK